ncbi:MAG: hypothetical protein JXA64_02745 [Candidatus Fermentibacteraceae bacterium]|nr:hypothetical protein [Candidatus Fermentibacteraceae bacterium]
MILNAIEKLASIRTTRAQLAGLFMATVILRNLLESVSAGMLFPVPAFVFHFPIAYVFPMLGLTALMHILSGYPLPRLLKLMVFAWTLTLLPPLLDYALGTSSAIGYFPLERSNAGFFLLNFFNPLVELPGTTAGIRIEAAIGCLLAGVFTWAVAKDRRVVRGTGTAILFAPVFLAFFTWPGLIYILTMDLFPYAETLQEYFQWHAATYPHLTGSLHYTVFLVDIVPVTLILAWFYRKLDREGSGEFAAFLRRRALSIAAPLAGAVYLLAAAGGRMTFADAASAAGAFLAALLIVMSRFGGTAAGWTLRTVALASALAVGWPTAALVMLGLSLAMLPGPAWLAGGLAAAAAFLTASSPAGLSWGPVIIGVCVLCALTISRRRWLASAAGGAALAAVMAVAPDHTTSYTQHYSWLMDAISRNGRLDLSLPVAREMAASGGDMLNLAKAELEAGDLARSRWCYETALGHGSRSPDAYRLGLNLALSQGMQEQFDSLLQIVVEDRGLLDEIDLGGIMVSRAVRETDTLFIQRAMELRGPSPQLYNAFSAACAGSGDLDRAALYARAAVSHPDAMAGQYAWAIHVTAITGGDYDSLYRTGMDAFPGSVEIMEARLMAPLAGGGVPDREDLLRRCLALSPASTGVLRTAALWYLSAGCPDSALKYSERAIASMGNPDPATIRIACAASAALRDTCGMITNAAYGLELYPGDFTFMEFLPGLNAPPDPSER